MQRGHSFDINDQTHPKRAGPGQDWSFAQADVQRFDLVVFSASFNDACHQPLLRLIVACALQLVDVPYQRIVVENNRHLIQCDHHKIWRYCQAQIQQMRIRHNVIRTVSPDPHSNLQVFQFDVAL